MSKADVRKKADALESKLKGKLFLGGARPSAEDVKTFNDLLGADNTNLFRWVKNLASYTKEERAAWGAPYKLPKYEPKPVELPKPAAAKAEAPKAEAPKAAPVAKAEAPKAAPKKEDDDVDLFGEETEEDKAALAAKKKADEEKKKSAKPAAVAKSSLLIDIKPWDDETNLKEFAEKLKQVQHDGILWGAQKFVPVAYGVNKLVQMVTIEDDKVSSDDPRRAHYWVHRLRPVNGHCRMEQGLTQKKALFLQ